MARTHNVKIHSRHSVLDGTATIYKVPLSGDVWQFRMYLPAEKKHYRKTLRTRDFDSAYSKAKTLALDLLGRQEAGKKIFGVTLRTLVDQYLEFRQREVDGKIITAGRLVTIKSHLNHLLAIKGEDLKASELDRNALFYWRLLRREKHPEVKDVTVRNETATHNALCRWAYRQGLIHFQEFDFDIIKISQGQVGKRDTFTLEEYESLIRFMRTYVSKKSCPHPVERAERLLMRDYVLISSNTAMRVGELRQLKWGDIGRIEKREDEDGVDAFLVEINVRAETSKVRTQRKIITRGGEYFDRIKGRLEVVDKEALVFSGSSKNGSIAPRIWERHWRNLMEGVGLGNYKDRNVTWYSLRHFAITLRVRAGVDIIDIAKQAGTSVGHIENTYLKYTDDMKINAALKSFQFMKSVKVTNDGKLAFTGAK
jgi:integrase